MRSASYSSSPSTIARYSFFVRRLSNWSATCLCDQSECVCPGGPQYAAYGNAVTVNAAQWVIRRIVQAEAEVAA